nr:MAG TPA: hypothetical protein [Caudoviricetes sp.]
MFNIFADCFWALLATICIAMIVAIVKTVIDLIRKK